MAKAKRREAEEPKNLTATQEKALLLLASGETVTATADAVGVSRQTVSENETRVLCVQFGRLE